MIPSRHLHRPLALALCALVAAGPAAAAKSVAKAAQARAEQPAAPGAQAHYGVKLGAFFNEVMAGEDILRVSKGLHLVVDMIENVTG